MTTTITKEFVVSMENKPGAIAEIAAALGKTGVGITGFMAQEQGDFGTVRLITTDPMKTEAMLKSTRHAYRAQDVLLVTRPHKPGEIGRVANALQESRVNVRASYVNWPEQGDPQIVFSVDDIQTAKKAV